MPLSCSCDGDYEWFFFQPSDYTTAPAEGKRKRCSCGELIPHASVVAKFNIFREPRNDVEVRIHGDEVPMAPKWLCERCADLYFSFVEVGFSCVSPNEDMRELAREYADMKSEASK